MSNDSGIYIHRGSESGLYYVAHLVSFYPEDYFQPNYPSNGNEFIKSLPYRKKLDYLFSKMVLNDNAKLCLSKKEAYEEANIMLAERGYLVEHGVIEV